MDAYNLSAARLSKNIKEGRGRGRGSQYIPWIKVREVGSIGCVHQFACAAMGGREVHLLSDAEFATFLYELLVNEAVEIREQFPLDAGDTSRLAAAMGVHHPTYAHDGKPAIITTDMVVTYKVRGRLEYKAISIKSKPRNRRPADDRRFELECAYWAERGVGCKLVLSYGLTSNWARNLAWLYPISNALTGDGITREELVAIDAVLYQMRKRRHRDARSAYTAAQREENMDAGRGLMAFRQALASKVLETSIDTPDYTDVAPEDFVVREDRYDWLANRGH